MPSAVRILSVGAVNTRNTELLSICAEYVKRIDDLNHLSRFDEKFATFERNALTGGLTSGNQSELFTREDLEHFEYGQFFAGYKLRVVAVFASPVVLIQSAALGRSDISTVDTACCARRSVRRIQLSTEFCPLVMQRPRYSEFGMHSII